MQTYTGAHTPAHLVHQLVPGWDTISQGAATAALVGAVTLADGQMEVHWFNRSRVILFQYTPSLLDLFKSL